MPNAPVRQTPATTSAGPLRFPFTKRDLAALKPTDQRRWAYDVQSDGLAIQITPAGIKTFYLAKRIEGRYRKIRIGNFPDVTVTQARKQAAKLNGQIADGKNPADERRQTRAATTFGELFETYLTKYAKQRKRTWEEDERQYERHLKRWAGRSLDQIKRQDVAALHARIGRDAPIAANRMLALVSKLYTFASSNGYTGDNPARGIEKFPERQRDRFLGQDELPYFLDATDAEKDPTFCDYFRLLLFTGQRRENVASMRWDEIDFRRRVWTIPPEKFKTDVPVEIPLVSEAVAILRERQQAQAEGRKKRLKKGGPADDPRDGYVFPSKRRTPKTLHLTEPKDAFRRVCRRAGLNDVRLHDLRRTTASWATMQGVPYPVVARMVGHKVYGVTGIYARSDLAAVRAGFVKTVDAMLRARRTGVLLGRVLDRASVIPKLRGKNEG